MPVYESYDDLSSRLKGVDSWLYVSEDEMMFSEILDDENTYNYYASRGSYATISLVDCSKLEPIAEVCHKIHQKTNVTATTDGLQYYNRNSKPIFFDFLQYTKSLATQQEAEDLYNTTCNAVIYKAATTKFSSLTIDPDNYSGLSTYILGTSPTNEYYYTTLDWYDRVYN